MTGPSEFWILDLMYVSRTTGHLSAWRLVWELRRVASRIKIGVARRYQRHASVVKCTVVRYVVAFSSLRPRVGPHAAFGDVIVTVFFGTLRLNGSKIGVASFGSWMNKLQ